MPKLKAHTPITARPVSNFQIAADLVKSGFTLCGTAFLSLSDNKIWRIQCANLLKKLTWYLSRIDRKPVSRSKLIREFLRKVKIIIPSRKLRE